MPNLNSSALKLSFAGVCLLAATTLTSPALGQHGPSVTVGGSTISGFPEDWSHRHVVYSNAGSEGNALQGGYEHWLKVVNDPRYVFQQLKNHRQIQGPAGAGVEYWSHWISDSDVRPDHHGKKPSSDLERDWNESLVGPGLAAGQFPAKYNYSTTSATCTDYVVFPTGAAGATGQATIVAFNSVYSGCPLFSGGKPVVDWAYDTGSKIGTGYIASTSPVISLDGTQVAYIESNGTTARLVLLKVPTSGSGMVGAPVTLTPQASGAAYKTCTAPCFVDFSLGANDTSSAPFYTFSAAGVADTLYVGDDTGKVHELVGAFSGTPNAIDSTTGWPVTGSAETTPTLSSPIYDGVSNRIFVTDGGGFLHSFTATTTPGTAGAPGTPGASGRLENNTTHVFGPPVVDPSTELVYAFVAYGGDTNHPSHVNQFPAATALAGGFGTSVTFPDNANGGSANPSTSNMWSGAFDNQYYNGTGTTGNLYACENGIMYQIPMSTFTTVNTYNTPVSAVGVAATCSPVTEFLGVKVATALAAAPGGSMTAAQTTAKVTSGTNIANNDFIQIDSEIMHVTGGAGTTTLTVMRGVQGTTPAIHTGGAATQDIQDWLFTSVEASGNAASCIGACIYNYNVIGAGTTGTPTAGLAATGGTSGIIIDSSSTSITGDEEVYYTLLGGTSAIQASQAGLQ